jgi:GxxExxY protein
MKNNEELDRLSKIILEASIDVHKEIGPGLLESIYHLCLTKELVSKGIIFASSVRVPLIYKGTSLNKDFIIDILVEDEIIIELKAVEIILPVHTAQIISYLKLTNKRLGFLINFNAPKLKEGFRRFVNNF